jgi:hypothetical protein
MSSAEDGHSSQPNITKNQDPGEQKPEPEFDSREPEATLQDGCIKVEIGAPSSFGIGGYAAHSISEIRSPPNSVHQVTADIPLQETNSCHVEATSPRRDIPNIESTPVEDDPREWSRKRKVCATSQIVSN